MNLFVIAYKRSAHDLRALDQFDAASRKQAFSRRFELELEYKDDQDIEVVLIEASDLDALKRSHGRYFMTPEQLLARKA